MRKKNPNMTKNATVMTPLPMVSPVVRILPRAIASSTPAIPRSPSEPGGSVSASCNAP